MKVYLYEKPEPVEATQWKPYLNAQVRRVMDWLAAHDVDARFDDHLSMSLIDHTGERVVAAPGDWVVRWADGRFDVVNERHFDQFFKPAAA